MEHVVTYVCLDRIYIYCTHTECTVKCTVVERSDGASNYQGEILGAIIA